MTATSTKAPYRLDPVIITTDPTAGHPSMLRHYLNIGLTSDQVKAFQLLRPTIHGRVAAVLALTFVGGFLAMSVGVVGAWSANGFNVAKVMSSRSVMPVDSSVWGSVGILLLGVFVATLIASQRANAAKAAAFDGERALLWEECRGSLVLVDGFSGEAEHAVVRLELLAEEANGIWESRVPLMVHESFVAAGAALGAGSAGEAGRILDGVAEVLSGEVVAAAV